MFCFTSSGRTLDADAKYGVLPGVSSPASPKTLCLHPQGGYTSPAKTPQLTLFLQVTHTVALGTIGESNYHFGVTYVGTKQLSPTEVSFL